MERHTKKKQNEKPLICLIVRLPLQRFFSRRKTISSARIKWSVGWMMSFLGSLLAGIWPEVRPECDSAADQGGFDLSWL